MTPMMAKAIIEISSSKIRNWKSVERTDDGRRALAAFTRAYSGVTIAELRSSLPRNAFYLDRTSEGFEKAGMPP